VLSKTILSTTATDLIPGLMWQKEGSSEGMAWPQTKEHLNKLNHDRLAGNSDWRLLKDLFH